MTEINESELERILTHSYKTEMLEYMRNHSDKFEELFRLALDNKQPYSWRAAWLMWSYMEKNDSRLQKRVSKIIAALDRVGLSQKRELLMILQKLNIPEKYEGKLFNFCVALWKNVSLQSSLRMNAMRIMFAMTKKYPDLKHEVLLLTGKQYMDTVSAGIKHSVNKMVGSFIT